MLGQKKKKKHNEGASWLLHIPRREKILDTLCTLISRVKLVAEKAEKEFDGITLHPSTLSSDCDGLEKFQKIKNKGWAQTEAVVIREKTS